jgi:hypothetical protein
LVFNNRGYIKETGGATFGVATTMFLEHKNCRGQNQRRQIDISPTGQITSQALACST